MAFREEIAVVRERRPKTVRASWTAANWARSLAISGVVGVFLAVAGAFNTGEMPLGLRLVYWLGLVLAGTPIAQLTFISLSRVAWLTPRPWIRNSLGTVLMALLYTLVVWWLTRSIAPAAAQMSLVGLFPVVLMISAGMTVLHLLVERRRTQWPDATAETPLEIRFLKRLPLPLRGAELYAVEAEDHYLRVHTSKGTDLVLCRMADAVAELHGVEGFRTHRSWWVAKAAVAKTARADGRAVLTLKSGIEAPVARTSLPALRQAGWL